MSRIIWGETGSRLYEAGVDRGVLYPPAGAVGVPWNGLTSVKEAPSGGDPQAYYQDGIKYFQIAAAEEFKATIEAFSAPAEFASCDGIANIYAGLSISQQPRKPFGFAYRTLIGNDVVADSFGYKIHLIYNALANPSGRDNNSLSNASDPMQLSWDIQSVPPPITGFKPSAHLIINSLLATSDQLLAVENIIYGLEGGSNARQPTVSELITIFGS
jgi:hypothetical protein